MTARALGVSITLALLCTSAAVAQQPRPDPIVGTWKLNAAQSKIPQVPGMPKEQTEIYRETGGNIEMALTRTTVDGGSLEITLAWPSEGGIVEYRTGTPTPAEVLVETLVAPGDWLVTYTQKGRQYGTMRKVVSADGKTMRQTFKGTIEGKPIEVVAVLDRQ